MSRKRSPNFSQIEIEILLDEVEKNKTTLFSKFSNVSTNASKKRAWESICEKINTANTIDYSRTVEEVKKKWSTYMSETKKKAAQNRREAGKTGGGPHSQALNSTQEKIVGIIGDTPITGIDGGIDTCEVNVAPAVFEKKDKFDDPPTCASLSCSSSVALQSDSSVSRDEIVDSGPSKKRKRGNDSDGSYESKLLKFEEEKLSIMRQMLEIEKERLEFDRQRLTIETQRHQVYLAKHGVTFE